MNSAIIPKTRHWTKKKGICAGDTQNITIFSQHARAISYYVEFSVLCFAFCLVLRCIRVEQVTSNILLRHTIQD